MPANTVDGAIAHQLLFAGSNTTAIANPIGDVKSAVRVGY
jgi:hypothetical protein